MPDGRTGFTPNGEAALKALDAGFAVFPTSPDGKRPSGKVRRRPGSEAERLKEVVPDWLLLVYPHGHAHAGELAGGFRQATNDRLFAFREYWPETGADPPGIPIPPGVCMLDVDDDGFPGDLLEWLRSSCNQRVRSPRGEHLWFRYDDDLDMPLQRGLYEPGEPGARLNLHVGDWKPPVKGYGFPPGAQREGKPPYEKLTPDPFTADPEKLNPVPVPARKKLRELYTLGKSTSRREMRGSVARVPNVSATSRARKEEKRAAEAEGRKPKEVPVVWRSMTTAEVVAALPDLDHGSGRRDILLRQSGIIAQSGALGRWRAQILDATAEWTSPENPDVRADVVEILDSAEAKFGSRVEKTATVDAETGEPVTPTEAAKEGRETRTASWEQAAVALARKEGYSPWIVNEALRPGSVFHLAVGLLYEHAGEMLSVWIEDRGGDAQERSPLYILQRSGSWCRNPEQAQRMLTDWSGRTTIGLEALGRRIRAEAQMVKDREKDGIGRLIEEAARRAGRAAVETTGEIVMRDAGVAAGSTGEIGGGKQGETIRAALKARGLLRCRESALDANGRYIGAANGVLDLHEARLLPREEGRGKFVTAETPHAYRPFKSHAADARADVAKLTEHLVAADAEYTWDCLAFALLGNPSKAFYLLFGEADGAKTTLMASVKAALGTPYAKDLPDGAIDQNARPASAGLTPEQECFARPTRFVFSDELKVQPNPKVLKDRSGGGSVTYRGVYGKRMLKRAVSASMMIATNPQNMPRFDLADDALRSRIRVIPCPSIDRPDPDYIVRMQQPDRAAALFAALVERCAALKDKRRPPQMPPSVVAAVRHVAELDMSELDQLAAMVVRAGEQDWLSTGFVWDAWKRLSGADEDQRGRVGRYTRGALIRALARRKGIGPAERRTDGEDRLDRGWWGWKLLDAPPDPEPEEAEEEPPPPEPPVTADEPEPDGEIREPRQPGDGEDLLSGGPEPEPNSMRCVGCGAAIQSADRCQTWCFDCEEQKRRRKAADKAAAERAEEPEWGDD